MCSNYRPASLHDLKTLGVETELLEGDPSDTYPGGTAPIILRSKGGQLDVVLGTFGLLPVWAKDRAFAKRTYNARSETVAEKPSFRHAWGRHQLCVIPARAIYEPCYDSGIAQWWRIEAENGAPLAIAGLWEKKQWPEGGPMLSFTMLTVSAEKHPVMCRFHKPKDEKRTVVFLDEHGIDAWLSSDSAVRMAQIIEAGPQVKLIGSSGRLP